MSLQSQAMAEIGYKADFTTVPVLHKTNEPKGTKKIIREL